MKKLLTILFTVLMVITLCGCTKKEETKPVEEEAPEVVDEPAVGPVAGGWTIYNEEPQSQTTEKGMAALEKALSGLTGAGYVPFLEMATQVVAGTNYMYLCKMTTVTPDAPVDLAVVVVYEDLSGNAELKSVTKLNLGEMASAEKEFTDDKALVGGWNLNGYLVEGMLPENAEKAFEKVMDGLVGVNYLQLALLGTQVVAGTNYAILAERSVVSPDATPSFCVMFIYEDLQGNATLNSVYPLDLADFNK